MAGRHAKPIPATIDVDAELFLVQAAQSLLSGDEAQAQAEEHFALDAGCTREQFAQYIVLLGLLLAQAGRTDEGLAMYDRNDALFLRTPQGVVMLLTARGRSLREAGDAENALTLHLDAERFVQKFGQQVTTDAIHRHTKQLTLAWDALI